MMPTKLQKAMAGRRLMLKITTERARAYWDALISGQRVDISAELQEAGRVMRNAVRELKNL